jgi:hypothetical protein
VAGDDRRLRERANEFLIRRVVNTKERAGRLLKPGSVAVLIIVTITGIGVVLREAGLPKASWWNSESIPTYILAVLAALTYVGYCLVVIGYVRTLKRRDQNARLYTACRDVATLVHGETDIERENIGVHVWTVEGLPGIRRLERRATFLPLNRPPSPITWRKGKGVLGQVWQRDEWILADLEAMAAARTETEFYAIPRENRFFFNWHDAKATRHYKAALVWPLHGGPENAPRVVGCLSVDVQEDGAVEALDVLWETCHVDLNAHIALCEEILRRG